MAKDITVDININKKPIQVDIDVDRPSNIYVETDVKTNQSDWNQTKSSESDYIKNKPFQTLDLQSFDLNSANKLSIKSEIISKLNTVYDETEILKNNLTWSDF